MAVQSDTKEKSIEKIEGKEYREIKSFYLKNYFVFLRRQFYRL